MGLLLSLLVVGSPLASAQSTTAAPRSPSPILTVLDVRDALAAGDRTGAVVRVVGTVSDVCQPLSCSLRTTLGGWERGGETVSLAGGSPIEAQLRSLAGKRVVIRARVGEAASRRLPSGEIVVSADRVSELIPIEIEN